ncbi:MAG: DUF438 domain-containing protein [Deltaproteobacteria bacterium]|nr:DUF438 domain-containing protein [Deltaproteobacteria bacterium]
MEITAKTKIDDLLTQYPFLLGYLMGKSPEFRHLKNPIMRKTMGKIATLEMVASRGKLDLATFIDEIRTEIEKRSGAGSEVDTADQRPVMDPQQKREALKRMIKDLHSGGDFQKIKAEFIEFIKDVTPPEIAQMEQELVKEGLPATEVKKLCDVHVSIFQDSLDRQEKISAPVGHPAHTFMLENEAAEGVMKRIDDVLRKIGEPPDASIFQGEKEQLRQLVDRLADINIHYVRKENQLFPILEAHGITAPPQVMWAVHDDIRASIKTAQTNIEQAEAGDAVQAVTEMISSVRGMIYKEEQILFPMCMEVFSQADWVKVARGEEEIGYAWVRPQGQWPVEALIAEEAGSVEPVRPAVDVLGLDTGMLTLEQINLMINHLPVDITFVDENDRVAYFSQGKERIFPRSPGVIGREVQNCHPPKSIHVVNKILDEFRKGARDVAEFWIEMAGKFIQIRYFAIRSADGAYKGTLEVSQDVTGIRALQGQKRLLDWD